MYYPEVDGLKKELMGEYLTGFYVSDDAQDVALQTSGGNTLVLEVDGDCCSRSWFEEILGLNQLLDAEVITVEEIPMPDPPQTADIPDGGDAEVLQSYGLRIVTNRGAATLVYRNDSNGYYGGYISGAHWVDGVSYSGFRPVTEDGRLW